MLTVVRASVAVVPALIVICVSANPVAAQPPRFGGDPREMQEQMFRRMDRNGNGVIDGEELEQMSSGFFREALAGRDLSRPMDQTEFSELSRQAMERARSSGGFGRGGGGGPGGMRVEIRGPDGGSTPGSNSSSRDASSRSDERRDGDRREGESRDDRRGDSRRSDREDSSRSGGSDSKSASRKADKPAGFSFGSVTFKLPDQYRSKDKDGDGQIGLYEWSRSDFATFRKLDRDGDGFLTPAELLKASGGTLPNFGIPSNVMIASTDPAAVKAALSNGSSPASSSSTAAPSGPPIRPAGPTAGPASATADASDESTRRAGLTFDILDRDRNGMISAEEWTRSRSMRPQFERANAGLVPPISRDQFVPAFIKVNPSFNR